MDTDPPTPQSIQNKTAFYRLTSMTNKPTCEVLNLTELQNLSGASTATDYSGHLRFIKAHHRWLKSKHLQPLEKLDHIPSDKERQSWNNNGEPQLDDFIN